MTSSNAGGSRSHLLAKSHALLTAQNMARSSLGIAVLKNSTCQNFAHDVAIRRIENEHHWRQRELRNRSRSFLAGRSGRPGPTIVFDRPPLHRDFTERVFLFQNRNGMVKDNPRRKFGSGGGESVPGYMRSTIASSNHIMSPLMPTLDAFQTVPKAQSTIIDKHYSPIVKRRPISATAAIAAATNRGVVTSDVRFRLAVQPSWPLTDRELSELHAGWQEYWQEMMVSRRSMASPLGVSSSARGVRRKEATVM